MTSARFIGIEQAANLEHDVEALGEELAAEISTRFTQYLRRRNRASSAATNRASSMGDPCLRRLVYRRTSGASAKPIDDTGLAIFNTGNMLEGPIRRLVEELGFEVHSGQQDFPVNDFNVSGHIDGKIRHHRVPVLFVLEIKTVNPYTWAQLKTADDIRNHAKSWVQKWAGQGQIYAALSEIQRWGEDLPVLGVMYVLFNKLTGQLKPIPSPLDYEQAEDILEKAVEIEAHLSAKTLPEFVGDPNECRSCAFLGGVCNPPINFHGVGMTFVDDIDIVRMLQQYQENKDKKALFEEADEYLFGSTGGRLRGVEYAVVPTDTGDFHVAGKLCQSTSYKIPASIKEPFKTTTPQGMYRKTVSFLPKEKSGGLTPTITTQ